MSGRINAASAAVFSGLKPQAPDPLLSLIALYRDDPRPGKIDLGVGVYRDAEGATPVFKAVKSAEAVLLRDQPTKAYLGPEGDIGFLERLIPVVFGTAVDRAELAWAQTPGGTGALRLGAELAAAGLGGAGRIWLGTPSWPIHAGIFERAGLEVKTAAYYSAAEGALDFDRYMAGLEGLKAGDVVLLHGACHNPTGADLSPDQWRMIGDFMAWRGAIPFVDLAYQGLGAGLEPDAAGLRSILQQCETVLVAQSCDKNFGLYRERTGALFVRTRHQDRDLVQSNVLQLARYAWSMPPDHGAAVVRTILKDEALDAAWRVELGGIRARLNAMRKAMADELAALKPLREQHGLFALLHLSTTQVEALRRQHAIYMAGSGRINVAGLNAQTIPIFARALEAVF